jgi:hypothetical protein
MHKKIFALLIWVCVIFSVLLTLVNNIIISTSAAYTPDSVVPFVTLELEDTNKTAHVAHGDSCEVKFNGTVSITCSPGTRMEVSLGVTSIQCYAYIYPPTIWVYRSEEVPFEVTAILDKEESCKTVSKIIVGGTWKILPSGREGVANPEEGVTGTITIAPFYQFSFLSGKSYDEATPGSKVDYGLTIINEGNDDDTYHIQIVNSDELIDKGLEVTINPSRLEIAERTSAVVTVSVNLPSDFSESGINRIIVEANSEKGSDQNLSPEVLELELNVPMGHFIFTSEFIIIILIVFLFVIIGSVGLWHRRKKRSVRNEAPNRSKLRGIFI